MRNDLTQGCAACRLRYSARLDKCPICAAPALTISEATFLVQPTTLVTWLVKWLIVLSVIPALVLVMLPSVALLVTVWPPENAYQALALVFAPVGICLGTGIVVGFPLLIWIGILTVARWGLKRLVARPRRALRVAIDASPRPRNFSQHPMHRAFDNIVTFIKKQIDEPKTAFTITIAAVVFAQAVAEVYGKSPSMKWGTLEQTAQSLAGLAVTNVVAWGVVAWAAGLMSKVVVKAYDFLCDPPYLFGYQATPAVDNESRIKSFTKERAEVTGRVVPLDDQEIAALAAQLDTQDISTDVQSPLSGKTCFAFRLVGESGGQPVDDADAVNFTVVTDDNKRCVVTRADVVVLLPAKNEIKPVETVEFLEERGLPSNDVSVREAVLNEGDRVRVVGRLLDLHVGSAGYRGGSESRMMLDAGDGLPVVISPGETKLL